MRVLVVDVGGTHVKKLPKGCRAGDNTNAFAGGFRLWENNASSPRPARARSRRTA